MSHIEAGEFIPGDLPPLFWCGVMIGMTIGMAMSGWWPGAFGMAIAAGTYCGRFAKFPSPL
jgi:hypothetical protein